MSPIKVSLVTPRMHIALFNFRFAALEAYNPSQSLQSCSFWWTPDDIIIHRGIHIRNIHINHVMLLWYTSGAEVIPKNRFRNLYLLKGVLNIHNLKLSTESFSCQNPEKATNLLKNQAFVNWVIISSPVGNLKYSCLIALLRCLGSRCICNWLLFFSAITKELTDSVDSWVFCIIVIFPFLLTQPWVYHKKQKALFFMSE